MKPKIIFIFLDGFGLAPPGQANPHRAGSMPFLESLLQSPLVSGAVKSERNLLLAGIDAGLGVPGIPQSATGQTALFTGVNAAQALGRHDPAFPNQQLVGIIRENNLYQKLMALGASPVFANAYSQLYFQYVKEKRRRHSVTTHCLLASGLPILTLEDMKAGRAVFWDITRTALATYPIEEKYETVSGMEAGRHLAKIAQGYDATVFECFLPDLIGHKHDWKKTSAFLLLLDDFLSAVYKNKPENATILVTSDHGNIEDLSTGQHTSNPVPLLVLGPAAPLFTDVRSIADITPAILGMYQIS